MDEKKRTSPFFPSRQKSIISRIMPQEKQWFLFVARSTESNSRSATETEKLRENFDLHMRTVSRRRLEDG